MNNRPKKKINTAEIDFFFRFFFYVKMFSNTFFNLVLTSSQLKLHYFILKPLEE